jgi:hypothetical protein
MNNDVAKIDQHPIGVIFTFDADQWAPNLFGFENDIIGE